MDGVERHLRKFRKEFTHIHDWYVKADGEIRKIEGKNQMSTSKEEIEWIRVRDDDRRWLNLRKNNEKTFSFRQHETI